MDYDDRQLDMIAEVFWDEVELRRSHVYDQMHKQILTNPWSDVKVSIKEQTKRELKKRIDKEGLLGYLERKRPRAGNTLTDDIISKLKVKGLL